jgi:hypothetical protein
MTTDQRHTGFEGLQARFAEAIFADGASIAGIVGGALPAAESRLNVYRNNVALGLINAVAARYPVVRKLLWDDAFERVAAQYVRSEPPRSPVLLEYGESFPQFLRTIGEGAAVDYLADIAELESARTRAYHAADAMPLDRGAFAALSPDRLANLRLKFHPSMILLTSRFPVVSIWEAQRQDCDGTIREWKPESVLVVRPHLHVEVWRLSTGGHKFFSALVAGRSVADAITEAAASAADFDLAEAFATLISCQAVVAIERD